MGPRRGRGASVLLHSPLPAKWNPRASVKLVPSSNRPIRLHRRRCAVTGGHRPPRTAAGPLLPIPIPPMGANRCAGWRRSRGRARLAARARLRRARAHRSSPGVGSPAPGRWPRGPACQCRARAGEPSGPSARERAGFVPGPAQLSEIKRDFYYFDTDFCNT